MFNVRRLLLLSVLLLILVALLGCGSARTYTVQNGDTLQRIAQKNQTTVPALVQLNKDRYPSLVTNPGGLNPGWQLQIPAQQDAGIQIESLLMQIARKADPPAEPAPAVAAARSEKIDTMVQRIFDGINEARAEKNLPPLVIDKNLMGIAAARSQDMIARNYFSHTDPGTGHVLFQDLLTQQNYPYLFAGENIAEIRNQGAFVPPSFTVYARYSATDLGDQFVTGWINSPDHYENIVNPHFRRTGIAIGVSADGTRVVATQVFSD